jgi:hypothetical protein
MLRLKETCQILHSPNGRFCDRFLMDIANFVKFRAKIWV